MDPPASTTAYNPYTLNQTVVVVQPLVHNLTLSTHLNRFGLVWFLICAMSFQSLGQFEDWRQFCWFLGFVQQTEEAHRLSRYIQQPYESSPY